MILINLLPHREERRKRRKVAFFAGLGVAAVAGLVIVGAWYLLVLQLTSAQQERNQFLKTEISKLEIQIKDIATLKAEIEALKARQKAVENLQTDRNIPVHVLNDLVRQTPEGVYFTSVKQTNQTLVLSGIAQTNERVSELLRNLAYNAEWLTKPDLVEIRAANVQTATREQKRLFDFSVRVEIKRPPEAKPDDAAQSKSGAAKSAKKS
ncbi:MAG: PilN domain-containing protein [Rhizobacter sp.]|nr:PilN domain-containing protein [Burkholderiaceae bacterium]MCO5122463.1 PilN domain-containing protein [Rhizobacter sp.]